MTDLSAKHIVYSACPEAMTNERIKYFIAKKNDGMNIIYFWEDSILDSIL